MYNYISSPFQWMMIFRRTFLKIVMMKKIKIRFFKNLNRDNFYASRKTEYSITELLNWWMIFHLILLWKIAMCENFSSSFSLIEVLRLSSVPVINRWLIAIIDIFSVTIKTKTTEIAISWHDASFHKTSRKTHTFHLSYLRKP